MTEILMALIPLLGIGFLAGVLAGLLGVGGGIVLVPAFFYMFSTLGYDGPDLMRLCLATSLATIIVTSIRSVQSHNKRGAVDWYILKAWGPYIVVGALIGVVTVAGLNSTVLQGIFGALGIAVGLYMLGWKTEWAIGDHMPRGLPRAGVGGAIGFISVLMGIGGGSLGVPLMTLHRIPIHRAVATAAGFGVIIALPSAIGFLFTPMPVEARPPLTVGSVNLPAFFVVIAMTLLAAPLGANLAHRLNPKPLKRIFGIFLILVAANMLWTAFG